MQQHSLKATLVKGKIEIGGRADILVGILAVVAVCLVEGVRAFTIGRVYFALVFEEVSKPVILIAIFVDSLLYTQGEFHLVVRIDDFFCALDNPSEDTFACVVIKVIAEVLNIASAFDFCIEGDNDESAPNAVIGGTYLGKMVGVKDKVWVGSKLNGSLYFFSA